MNITMTITAILTHPRLKNGFRYRGLAVSSGTAIHEALTNKDSKLADKLYDGLKADFVKLYGQDFWNSL